MSEQVITQQYLDDLEAKMKATKEHILQLYNQVAISETKYSSQSDALTAATERFLKQEYDIGFEGHTHLAATDEFVTWLSTRDNDPFDPREADLYKDKYFTLSDYYDGYLFDIDVVPYDETIMEVPLKIILDMKKAYDEKVKSDESNE